MALSWSPDFDWGGFVFATLGDTETLDLAAADSSTSNVVFFVSPDSCSVDIDPFTEMRRHVLPNPGPVGPIRFSVWTMPGPNAEGDWFVTVDDGGSGVFDDHGSWSFILGQLPLASVAIVADVDVEGAGSTSISAPTGPVLGCVVSLDDSGSTPSAPSISFPGDNAAQNQNYAHSGDDDTRGQMRGFASDLPGSFGITSSLMRRVVLVGPAPASEGSWKVGRIRWPRGNPE